MRAMTTLAKTVSLALILVSVSANAQTPSTEGLDSSAKVQVELTQSPIEILSSSLKKLEDIIHSRKYTAIFKRGLLLDQLKIFHEQLRDLQSIPAAAKLIPWPKVRSTYKEMREAAWKGEFQKILNSTQAIRSEYHAN